MSDNESSYEDFFGAPAASYEEFSSGQKPVFTEPPDTAMDVATSLGRGLAKGVIGFPGIVGDIQTLARKAEPYIGITPPKRPLISAPTSAEVIEAAKPYVPALGGEPETTAGKYAETVGSFMGTPGGVRGQVTGPKTLAESVVKQAVIPGAVSEAAGEATAGTGAEPFARILGSIVGGAPFSAPSGKSVARMGEAAKTAEAAQRAGVELPYFAATPSQAPKMLATSLRAVPIGAEPIFERSQAALEQIGKAAEDVAQRTGGKGAYEAGAIAKSGIANWIERTSADSLDRAYTAVDRAVNPNVKTPTSSLATTLQQMEARNAAAGLPGVSPAMDMVMAAATDPAGLTFSGMRRLRSAVGEKLGSGILPADISGVELKQIYAALSDDLKSAAQNAGGARGLSAFNRANNYARLINERREQMAKIIGSAGDISPESVLGRIEKMAFGGTRGDIEKLNAARKIMPRPEWENVSSGIISRLGRDVSGDFSPERFITAYDKMSESGRDALFGARNSPVRRSLEDIRTLSDRFKELNKYANPSGTARNLEGLQIIFTMMAHPYVAAGQIAYSAALSRILSNPLTAQKAAKLQRDYVNIVSRPLSPDAKQMALQNLYQAYERDVHESLGEEDAHPQREARATGGGVKAMTARQLIGMADAAKNSINARTKEILKAPDEHVVRALDIANKHI